MMTLIKSQLKTPHPSLRPIVNSSRVFLSYKNKKVGVYIKDILYVEADRNYCTVTTVKHKYVLSVPLKKFTALVSSESLIRIHRSYLVNIERIGALDQDYVYINDKSFPLSKSYKKALLSRFTIF